MPIERRKSYLLGNGEEGRILRSHGEGGTNAKSTREQVVATISRWNQPGRLRHNYTESKDSVLFRVDLDDGGRVSATKPINPYTPETVLVTAFPANGPRNQLTAEYIYEKSDTLQQKYWQVIFAQLLSAEKQLPLSQTSRLPVVDYFKQQAHRLSIRKDSQRHVFFMENTGPLSYLDDKYRRDDLEGYSPRTARTGAEIHAHVATIDEKWLEKSPTLAPGITEERDALRNIQQTEKANQFMTVLIDSMASHISNDRVRERFLKNVTFIMEEGVPVGYSLSFKDLSRKNILKEIPYFSEILKAHFAAYGQSLKTTFDLVDTLPIPQPSFRTYGKFEGEKGKDHLTITISPQPLSFGGPLESAGIELQRSPDVAPLATNEQKKVYHRRLMRTAQRLMRDKSYEVRRVRKFTEPEWP